MRTCRSTYPNPEALGSAGFGCTRPQGHEGQHLCRLSGATVRRWANPSKENRK